MIIKYIKLNNCCYKIYFKRGRHEIEGRVNANTFEEFSAEVVRRMKLMNIEEIELQELK